MLGKYIGEMNISAFPQLSLVIFFGVFVAVLAWVIFGFKPSAAEAQSRIPLDDEKVKHSFGEGK